MIDWVEGVLADYPDVLEAADEPAGEATAWNFTDLECGSAAVSAALDSTGGERL